MKELTEQYAKQVGFDDFTIERLTKYRAWIIGKRLQLRFETSVQMGKPPVCKYGEWKDGALTLRDYWFVPADGSDVIYKSFAAAEQFARSQPSNFPIAA